MGVPQATSGKGMLPPPPKLKRRPQVGSAPYELEISPPLDRLLNSLFF